MNSVRFIFRDICVNRFWSAWTRSVNVAHVVRRCRSDRGVREVIHCFRQAFIRPHRTFLLAVTAAYKAREDDDQKTDISPSCESSITNEELEGLIADLEGVDTLSRNTLFCRYCHQRLVIDKKHKGVRYCSCKNGEPTEPSPEGWLPYMEAEDVVIWRKEFVPGQGLYAYKVYGRYKDVDAQDFAAVQVDVAYRRAWDVAVAALSVIEHDANGVPEQAVLHWEVLWPRLFANRDYVYIRRHKEFNAPSVASPSVFTREPEPSRTERPSVHSHAKRKSIESYSKQNISQQKQNKVFAIMSRSCLHRDVPETSNAIRVTKFWSQMVVRTLDGADQTGMEFVLTYYDVPAVGGMPSGVATWATGRAAPTYLMRMRRAAKEYRDYLKEHPHDIPEYTPFHQGKVDQEEDLKTVIIIENELDMESSKEGPDIENGSSTTRDQSTQTEKATLPSEVKVIAEVKVIDEVKSIEDKAVNTGDDTKTAKQVSHESNENDDSDKVPEDDEKNGGWWTYLYPFYFFV